MGESEKNIETGLDRRELLRRLVASAGAAGAAAALPSGALGATAPIHSSAPPAAPRDAAQTAGSSVALGDAEPPDPSLAAPDWKPIFFDDHQDATVLAIADLMIPATSTPGARAAQVDRFIDLLLGTDAPGTSEDSSGTDFADLLLRKGSLAAQKRYIAALNWLDGYCLAHYSKPFTALDRAEQQTILDLATHSTSGPDIGAGADLFALIKSSVVTAYYSSEIGAAQELKYRTNPFQTGMPECEHAER
ncbi:MAG TPA: gluconate 2-dehydrogenase subunit 3 family protein [Terriglobia bacterium]|nr:gluconate 2-dehydrogenase subunit 3 family protein [Terriglobia bacterium]